MEDEAVEMELDVQDRVSVGEALRLAMDMEMEMATVGRAKAREEASVEDAEEIKGFDRKSVTSAINLDAGPVNTLWKNEREHMTDSVNTPSTPQTKKSPHSTSSISSPKSKA
jgi:hypothetical protein